MEGIKPEDIKFTPFTDGKIRVWFRMIDVGKDGYMCKDDFLSIADRFVKEYSLSGGKATEVRDWLVDGWNIVLDMDKHKESVEEMMKKMPLVVAMGNKVRSGARISEDEFTQAYGQLIEVYPQLAKESLEKMVGAFFEVFDEDSDCYITDAEMTSAMHCFGYDQPDLVKAAFASMDLDKDGKLSREEYVGGWVSFMLDQDKSNPFVKAFAPHLVEQ
ncbi:sarcoplasmic calcium-binding protein-like [Littorina saxatilis]|uniref:EF-hand domain-containing protein n=1 Tax=Littorina saxatilis TaxID=31220 RepID=A0AAN9B970_9CAEN